jgi:hypothetical protein
MLFASGFEEAILGYCDHNGKDLVVYSADSCVEIMMIRDGFTYDQAVEWVQYNVIGSYAGEETPLFIWSESSDRSVSKGE